MLQKLASHKVALTVIVAILVGAVAFSIFSIGESTKALRIWLNMAVLPLLIGISISIYRRVQTEYGRMRSRKTVRHFGEAAVLQLPISLNETTEIVSRVLKYFRWSVPATQSGERVAVAKGRLGPWGSILFHIGLVTLIAGFITGQMWGSRGITALTTGETFDEGTDRYQITEYGWFADTTSAVAMTLTLLKFDPVQETPAGITEVSSIRVVQGDETVTGEVSFNHGLAIGDRMVHQGKWGYSPGLLIRDSSGTDLLNGYVRITSVDGHLVSGYSDFMIVRQGLRVDMRFYPDGAQKDAGQTGETIRLSNPLLEVDLSRGAESLFSTTLNIGDQKTIGGYFVAFPKLKYWAQFDIVYDPTLYLLYVGSLIALAGLTIRAFFHRRSIVILISSTEDGSEVQLSGWAERYIASHRDGLARIIAAIEWEADQLTKKAAAGR